MFTDAYIVCSVGLLKEGINSMLLFFFVTRMFLEIAFSLYLLVCVLKNEMSLDNFID